MYADDGYKSVRVSDIAEAVHSEVFGKVRRQDVERDWYINLLLPCNMKVRNLDLSFMHRKVVMVDMHQEKFATSHLG